MIQQFIRQGLKQQTIHFPFDHQRVVRAQRAFAHGFGLIVFRMQIQSIMPFGVERHLAHRLRISQIEYLLPANRAPYTVPYWDVPGWCETRI